MRGYWRKMLQCFWGWERDRVVNKLEMNYVHKISQWVEMVKAPDYLVQRSVFVKSSKAWELCQVVVWGVSYWWGPNGRALYRRRWNFMRKHHKKDLDAGR